MDNAFNNLKKNGYHIIENFLSDKECKNLIEKIDKYYEKFNNITQRNFREKIGGDERLFGIENVDDTAQKIKNNDFFLQILKKYTNNSFLCPSTVLLGRLKYEKGINKNSGGDWHRDSLSRQVKVILYLTDVTEDNGNFQFIPNSRVKDLRDKFGKRVNPDNVEKIKDKIINITGKRGTAILVDTSNIHRGNVIKSGERYSLTTYYFDDENKGNKFIKRIKSNYIIG